METELVQEIKKMNISTQTPPKYIVPEIVEIFGEQNHLIEQAFMGQGTYYSITLDLVSLYLKGQKLLYTESKTYCEMILYALMLPAILISSACTVLNVPLKSVKSGATVVSALNGFNSFLLAFVTYMKLDAKAEAHKTSAYQFDKLQAMCEFRSGKAQMCPNQKISTETLEFINEIEKKVSEIKDANQFSIPEVVRYRYHHIYSFNIFAMMKKNKSDRSVNIQRLITITDLLKTKKETVMVNIENIGSHNVFYDFKPKKSKGGIFKRFFGENLTEKSEINIYDPAVTREQLLVERDNIVKDIIEHRNMSIGLTGEYNSEAEIWISQKQQTCFCIFDWLKT
jgi:hypothetical protein